MVEKVVYDPTKDKEGQKNVGSKKVTKPEVKATNAKAKETPPEKTKTYKINKYGFLHVDKDLAKHLNIELGKDKADVSVVIERIPEGFIVKLVAKST